jgi:hypothetical protein
MAPRTWILIATMLLSANLALAATQDESTIGYLWQAELAGPTQKCRVPARILFVVADAIVGGKIKYGKTTYVPKGRVEDNRDAVLSLIRFYDDPKPLVSLTAKADGTWNGIWTSQKKGCTGKARLLPR